MDVMAFTDNSRLSWLVVFMFRDGSPTALEHSTKGVSTTCDAMESIGHGVSRSTYAIVHYEHHGVGFFTPFDVLLSHCYELFETDIHMKLGTVTAWIVAGK